MKGDWKMAKRCGNNCEESQDEVNEAISRCCRMEYARKRFPSNEDLANLEKIAHD